MRVGKSAHVLGRVSASSTCFQSEFNNQDNEADGHSIRNGLLTPLESPQYKGRIGKDSVANINILCKLETQIRHGVNLNLKQPPPKKCIVSFNVKLKKPKTNTQISGQP